MQDQRTCRQCGKLFQPHQAHQVFCPPVTMQEKKAGRSACSWRWTAAKARKRNGKYKWQRECVVCGTTFTTVKDNAKYCSTGIGSCLAADRRAPVSMRVKRKRARAQAKLSKAALGTQGGRWVTGPCAECGTPYVARWHSLWPSRYCSGGCATRVSRRRHRAKHGRIDQAKKRARRYDVGYEPIINSEVFQRDSYRCGICHRKTKRDAKVPDSRAPTLDHIIPMSEGGPHFYINVQCACFECNWRKAAGAANDQLLLIGR